MRSKLQVLFLLCSDDVKSLQRQDSLSDWSDSDSDASSYESVEEWPGVPSKKTGGKKGLEMGKAQKRSKEKQGIIQNYHEFPRVGNIIIPLHGNTMTPGKRYLFLSASVLTFL